jgi:hypothetical protein
MMKRNYALFSVGATLIVSLFGFGVAHAIQVDAKKLEGMNKAGIVHLSKMTSPCGGRNGAACRKLSSLESEKAETVQSSSPSTPMLR